MEAFVYCWTDMKTNKLYVGWHKGSTDDGYICSSKLMLEEYNKRSNDFKREIIATGIAKDMVALESAILKAENVSVNEQYYNMHENNGKFVNKGHSRETIKKLKLAHINRTVYNQPEITDEWRLKQKQGIRKYWNSLSEEERKIAISVRNTKKKRDATLNRNTEIRTCPHCNKKGSGFGMDRWHMNNCRKRN